MSYIYLGVGNDGQDMWGTLKPPTVNEVWEYMSWSTADKKFVRDGNGTLMKTGTRPGLPPAHLERGGYQGSFPSAAVCEYVNGLKQKMKFFDDGHRMVYGRPDRIVEVEPSQVKHPISYPPPGFKLMTDASGEHQWVVKVSKYE